MSFQNPDETLNAVEVTHSPATASSIMATLAAVMAVFTSSTSLLALAVGVFGLFAVVGGLFAFDSERAMAVGTGVVFVGVVLSGVFGNSMPLLVFGALASVLAFDLGSNAFSVGRQMSDETETTRGELVHAASSVAVGVVIVGIGAGIYVAGLEGLSVSSLAFILFGAVLLIWAIRT